ncbi:MAG: ABC transporter permease subunit [Planctomycetota bacterium]
MQALYSWLWRLVPGNPQVIRIVQGGSRRLQHALVRIAYLGALIGLVVISMIAAGGLSDSVDLNDLAKGGAQVFRVIAYVQVILVCLIAPIFMAGAIASEQSGKTYNILLTTPLSNLQIVLGSLIGRLFFILALLLSGLPLFAIMLVFGGVPVSSIFIAFAVAALTAVFVGAIAVMLSVLRTGGRKAVFVFVISIAAFLIVVGSLDIFLLRQIGSNPGQTTVLTPLHPLLVLEATINRANYSPPGPEQLAGHPGAVAFYLGRPFAAFAVLSLGSAVSMIVFCSLWVRKVGTGDSRLAVWLKSKLRIAEGGAERRRNARELGDGNPIAWREANTRGKLAAGIIARYGFLAVGLIAVGLLLFFYHTDPYWTEGQAGATASSGVQTPAEWFIPAFITLLVAEVAIITLVALYMSAGSVSKEREDGTLDIMLTTPITPKYYIWGKLRGLVKFLSVLIALPVISVFLVSAYTFVGSLLQWGQVRVGDAGGGSVQPLMLPEAGLVMFLMLVPFVAVCVATGMNFSLKSKGVLGAVVWSVSIIGLGALVLGLCGLPASQNIPLIGPILNAFSPTTNIIMIVQPYKFMSDYQEMAGFSRVNLVLAGLAVAGGYAMIVWGVIAGMVKGFDHTVRKLSGTK